MQCCLTFAKQNKETTSDDENDTCNSCNKPADGETIQCDWCGEWERKICAELSNKSPPHALYYSLPELKLTFSSVL